MKLIVHDTLGPTVATLMDRKQKPGHYRIHFDVRKLTGGLYFYTLTADGFSQTRKMLFVH